MKKNLTRIIATIFFIVLAVYFLYPTYKDYQLRQELAKLTGPDSINYTETRANDLRTAQEKRIKLGLDLKGGVYVVLDVDVVKLLEDLSRKKDEQLTAVLNDLRNVAVTSDEPILDLLKNRFQQKGMDLKSYFGDIRETSEDVEKRLQKEIDGSLERAMEVVRNRVDRYGVAEPSISKQGNSRIIVELPGVGNPEDVRKLLQGTALLEFKLLKEPEATVKVMQAVNKVLAGTSAGDSTHTTDSLNTSRLDSLNKNTQISKVDSTKVKTDSTKVADKKVADKKKSTDSTKKNTTKKDTIKKNDSTNLALNDTNKKSDTGSAQDTTKQLTEEEFIKQNPLFFTLVQINPQSGQADGYVKATDRSKVERLLAREDVQSVIPSDMEFIWSQKSFPSEDGTPVYTMIAVKKDAELTGKVIIDASSNIDPTSNKPIVTMKMSDEGSADWARITGANINKRCAIVLDNLFYSAPVIRNKITGGSSQIEGMESPQEARLLEIILKAGSLPAPLKIIEERTVGPSLGEDSIRAGITSSVAALLLVALFMAFYYSAGGIVADLALIINVLFILGILAAFQATLTLPGIAGLILTLGMAVDTNVLIYERIREESATGKPLRTAIEIGYKKAFSAIIDSHITSLITGLVLLAFGTGPVQGFAVTLLAGIVVNLFTAIVITHIIFDIMVEKGRKVSFG